MNILIFRTDIKKKKSVKKVKRILAKNPKITDCFIDIKDIDNVLRLETRKELKESDIIYLVKYMGFQCEVLV